MKETEPQTEPETEPKPEIEIIFKEDKFEHLKRFCDVLHPVILDSKYWIRCCCQ